MLAGSAMSAQQEVHYLSELKQLSVGSEYEYVGMAKVYNNKYLGMTLDDGSAFVTLAVTDGDNLVSNNDDDTSTNIPVEAGNLVSRFKGKVLNDEFLMTPGPSHKYSAELGSIEYIPTDISECGLPAVLATADEHFDDYMFRLSEFRDVKVSKYNLDLPNVTAYEVVTPNGSKGIFLKSAADPADYSGEYAWLRCTPASTGYPFPAGYVELDDVELGATPLAEVTKAKQINDIEAGNSFAFEGEAVVYFVYGGFVTLDNGEEMAVLGTEYWDGVEMPEPGDVVKSFNGRAAYPSEGMEVTGGPYFANAPFRIDCRSIVTTGETRELIPVEADASKRFSAYSNSYVRFRDVTIGYEDHLWCYAELTNGARAYVDKVPATDGDICGEYDEIVCVPVAIPAYPGAVLYNVTLGNKAGVANVAADAEVEYEYYDLQGRHIAAPTASGIYLVKGSDGSVTKLRK